MVSRIFKAEILVAEKCVWYNFVLAVWWNPLAKCELASVNFVWAPSDPMPQIEHCELWSILEWCWQCLSSLWPSAANRPLWVVEYIGMMLTVSRWAPSYPMQQIEHCDLWSTLEWCWQCVSSLWPSAANRPLWVVEYIGVMLTEFEHPLTQCRK